MGHQITKYLRLKEFMTHESAVAMKIIIGYEIPM